MSAMKVLVIGPDPVRSQGGMATVIANTLRSESLNGCCDIDMYSSFVDGGMFRRALHSVSKELAFRPGSYDIYHVHMCSGTSTWRKMRYVKKLGRDARKVVLHIHGAEYHEFYDACSSAQKKRIKDLCASVGRVVVLSEEWRDFFIARSICDPGKLVVLYNAVEIPDEGIDAYENRNVLFMGRLAERKSPDVLMRAAVEVLRRFPDTRFYFGGDGDVARYRSMAETLGIANACDFVGWVNGPAKHELIQRCSVYCLPSRNEGMPMSVLEAMSYGLATIATPVGGVPRVIEDGRNGLLVPVGDYERLAAALLRFLGDSDLRKRIGMQGRRDMQSSFGMRAYAEKLAAVYGDVIDG